MRTPLHLLPDAEYVEVMREFGIERLPAIGPTLPHNEERARKALAALESDPEYVAALERMRALRLG